MCVVSMVTDHYWQKYPKPEQFPLNEWPDLAELRRKAEAYDELMKQKDCVEPAKDAWFKAIEKRLSKLEKVAHKPTKAVS